MAGVPLSSPEIPAAARSLFELITSSYRRLLGHELVATDQGPEWLFERAPFAILAHDGGSDPHFTYANRTALRRFGYAWDELVGLPSRLSAEPVERAERQRLLDAVSRDGFIRDYRGIRIEKNGQRFWIEKATVWQLIDTDGRAHGQAAMFSETVNL